MVNFVIALHQSVPEGPLAPLGGGTRSLNLIGDPKAALEAAKGIALPRNSGDLVSVTEFFTDLWQFLRVRNKFWLSPLIVLLLLLGTLIVFSQGSALAPFIYSVF